MGGNLNLCGVSIVFNISPTHVKASEVEKHDLVDTENQWITQKRKKAKKVKEEV